MCSKMHYCNMYSEDQVEDVVKYSSNSLKFYLKMALEFQPWPVAFLHGQTSACLKKQVSKNKRN